MSQRSASAPQILVTILDNDEDIVGRSSDLLADRILGFSYDDSDELADAIKLTLDNQDLALFEQGEDVLGGTLLEVSWGYVGRMSPPRRGIIKKIGGGSTLTVEAQAESAQLHRETRAREWAGKTRSGVVREIADGHGYVGALAEIEKTAEVYETISQMGETDAAFLTRLAGKERFKFYIDDTGFHWHSRKFSSQPTHVVEHRPAAAADSIPILTWSVDSNLARRVGRITVKGRDPITKKEITATATSGDVERATLGEVIEVVDPETLDGKLTKVELKRNATSVTRNSTASTPARLAQEAAARYRVAERETVKLSLTVEGDPTIRAKSVVEVRGLTALFDGLYFVKKALHRIGSNGYTVEMKLIRDGKGAGAGSGITADSELQQQGGDRNTQDVKKKGEVVEIEVVDPETLEGRIEYRRT